MAGSGMVAMDDPGVAEGWTTYQDPDDGMPFYYNLSTGESTWDRPPGSAPLPEGIGLQRASAAPSPQSAEAGKGAMDEKPKSNTSSPQAAGPSPPLSPSTTSKKLDVGPKEEVPAAGAPEAVTAETKVQTATEGSFIASPVETLTVEESVHEVKGAGVAEGVSLDSGKGAKSASSGHGVRFAAVSGRPAVLLAYDELDPAERLRIDVVVGKMQSRFRQRRDLRGRVGRGAGKVELGEVGGFVFREKATGRLLALPKRSVEAITTVRGSGDFEEVGEAFSARVGAELLGLGAPGEGRRYVRVVSEFGGAEYFFDEETRVTYRSLPLGGEVVKTVRRVVSDSTRAATARAAAAEATVALLGALGSARRASAMPKSLPAILDKQRTSKPALGGWLYKSDPSGRKWKRRYVIVNHGKLEYYGGNPVAALTKHGVRETALGSVSLHKAKIVPVPDNVHRGAPGAVRVTFGLATPDRVYYFGATDQREAGRFKVRLSDEADRLEEEEEDFEGGKDFEGGDDENDATSSSSKKHSASSKKHQDSEGGDDENDATSSKKHSVSSKKPSSSQDVVHIPPAAAEAIRESLLEATRDRVFASALDENGVQFSKDGHRFPKAALALHPWAGVLVVVPEGARADGGEWERSTTTGTLQRLASRLGVRSETPSSDTTAFSLSLGGSLMRVVTPSSILAPTDPRRDASLEIIGDVSPRTSVTLIFRNKPLRDSWAEVLAAFVNQPLPYSPLLNASKDSIRTGPIQGFLTKSDRSGTSWKRRFFTLNPAEPAPHLSWFASKDDADDDDKHRGVLYTDIVDQIQLGSFHTKSQSPWTITLHAREGERSLICAADNADEFCAWILAFARCPDLRSHVKI